MRSLLPVTPANPLVLPAFSVDASNCALNSRLQLALRQFVFDPAPHFPSASAYPTPR